MKRRYEIRQHDRCDCGAACLASIASFYGLELPLIRIREMCGTSEEGTSIKGIVDAAGKLGFSVKAMKSADREAAALQEIPKPAVLHIRKENGWLHFVVLYRMSPRKAVIMDPGRGELVRISIEELEKLWTGYLILLSPLPDFSPGEKRGNIYARMKELFLLNRRDLVYALTGSIVYIVIGLSTSVFLQQIIDKVLPSREFSLLLMFACVMSVLTVLSLFIGYFRSLLTLRAGIRMDGRLVVSYLNHLFRLPLSFFATRGAGELNSRIGDVYRIRSFITVRFTVILISSITLLASFILLFTYYWKLAALTLLSVPLYGLIYYLSKKISKKMNREIIESSARFEEINVENLSAIHTIKHFEAYDRFLKKAEAGYTDLCRKIYKGGRWMTLLSTCSEGVSRSLTLMILTAGAFFCFESGLSVGELVSFYSVVGFFSSPVMALVESSEDISEAQISASRLFEIMDCPVETDKALQGSTEGLKGNISLKNICFSYPGQMELIRQLEGEIRAGSITVVKGDNGSGKSTLAALLMKTYLPDHGEIEIDGVDLKYIATGAWRKYISIVPQHPDMFSGSILENIVPDQEDPDLQKVISVCREAGLEEMLRARGTGLMFQVGEGGKLLSGGERQKVSLARALYRDPSILILDEALSALDTGSRERIYRLLKRLSGSGKTVVMISHDQESMNLADNVIDMNSNAHSRVEDYAPVIPVV